MSVIESGKYVIVRKQKGDLLRLAKMNQKSNVTIEKLRVNLGNAIGKPFGLFEVKNGQIGASLTATDVGAEHLKTLEDFRSTMNTSSSTNPSATSSRKRPLQDDGEGEDEAPAAKMSVQSVTMEEVLSMKSMGAGTSVIVSTLVQGNANFAERTDYAKEKYVSKKAKHHSDQVYILPPTIRLIAQTIYRRNCETAGFLRPDMLSSMLYYASIIGGSKVLVYDESSGLMTAAILQRLDGKGELYFLYKNLTFNSHEALQAMNFNPIEAMPFRPIRLSNLAKVIVNETPLPPHGMAPVDTVAADEESTENSDDNLFAEVNVKEQLIWIHERILDRSLLDSIVIVSNSVSPLELLQRCFKSLRSSGNVVVYTVIQEEICDIYSYLEENGAICIQIQEQANREMQILRDRCHPMLQTHVASGYLITAIKTVTS